MSLCGWLITIGDGALAPHERNGAAARIYAHLNAWARPYLSRVAPCRLGEDDVDEAVQHLLTRCALGASRFKGSSEGEAHSWCMRVLANKGRDICRERRRTVSTTVASGDDGDDERAPFEPSVLPDHQALAMKNMQAIFDAIQLELPRLHRPQDLQSLMRAVTCHVEARFGATMEEQIASYGEGDGEATSPQAVTRVQNRIYQYRNRGKAAACGALTSLVAQGQFAPEDVEDARRLLGCDIQAADKENKEGRLLS